MIFGKTHNERSEATQKYLEAHYDKWIPSYAWLPKRLSNGHIAWLEPIAYKLPICKYRYGGGYFIDNTGKRWKALPRF